MSLLKQWRYLLLATFSIIALTAFAACGDDDDDGGSEGGTLRVQTIEPASLDPHFSSFAQDISLQRMLWRGLYSLDTDNQPVPAMAASDPEISEDGTVFTITLREGLMWSDDDDLLAEDFVAGIHRTCNPINAGEYQYVLANIVGCDEYYTALSGPDGEAETADDLDPADDLSSFQDGVGVRAVDDLTIEFTLENPGPTFQILLSLWMTFPVPAHLFEDAGATWPVGPDAPGALAYNGPFMLTGYEEGTGAQLEPNPNWSADHSPVDAAPAVDGVDLRFIDDFSQSVRSFGNDELEFTNADLTQLDALVSQYEPTGQYYKLVKASTRGLQMQQERPPLDDMDVRMAIGKSVDWQRMIDNCYGGGHELTTTWIPVGVPGGKPADEYADILGYDVEAAQELLADAGFEGGDGIETLSIIVRQGTESECAGQFIQEELRVALGIETEVEALEGPVRSSRFTEEDFDLFPGGWTQDYPDPENWIVGLFEEPGEGLNHYNCDSQEIRDLVGEAEFSLDNEARIEAYARANEIISTEVCGIFNFYHEANHYLKAENVVGMFENSTVQDAVVAGDWAVEAWAFE